MRISIRQQLAFLLVLSSLIGLAVLAVATWVVNHDFVLNVAATRLQTTAVLKAAQIAFNLELMQTAATFVTTRAIIQGALARYNNGSDTSVNNWISAKADLEATLGDVGPLQVALVLQAEVYSRNISGPAGSRSVFNGTGVGLDTIILPWTDSDGSQVYLGKSTSGYPPALYPNLTISNEQVDGEMQYTAEYGGEPLGLGSTLVLGPLSVNETFSLLSMTLPIVNNTSSTDILGWVTVVTDARLIQLVQQDQRGLGDTGETLLLGPTNTNNNFPPGVLGHDLSGSVEVRYLLPLNSTAAERHPNHVVGVENLPFPVSAYPAVESALKEDNRGLDDVGSILRTHNEANKSVSVGYSVPPTNLVDWVVIVEQARSEVWEPINHLRTIILACLFAVAGFWMIASFPLAHWSVLPIIRLRAASEQTIDLPHSNSTSQGPSDDVTLTSHYDRTSSIARIGRKEGFVETIARWRGKRRGGLHIEQRDDKRFRIPGKVPEKKKPWIKDEMTDLIHTFNEMSDELYVQYSRLEERVRQRTAELELAKKSAEAANESKTLFVANVSHELKTPLNGILGMCAVCMEEDDPVKLKQSLGIIYKSGDLLLRTLSDLLTFSTNQVGHQVLKLDEKEFSLRDMESQVLAIFGEQAKDRQIHLSVAFEEIPGVTFSLPDNRRLRDISLWGDIHRILQIVINLTSNALKFTPAGGSVVVLLRALIEAPPRRNSRVGLSPTQSLMQRHRQSKFIDEKSEGTANFINPRESSNFHDRMAERGKSPPPGNDMFVELEVRDTGPGIPEHMQHQIFEPFVQADAGLSRKHSGTGLGLSICSQLASLMRGTISLKSTVGQGSVFTVKLPLRRVTGTASARTSQDGNASASSSIAVIEEEPEKGTTAFAKVAPVAVDQIDHAATDQLCAPPQTPNLPPSPGPALPKTPGSQTAAIKKAGKDIKASKEAQQDFSKVRVLVAEDNKVNQEVIVRMLKLEKIFDVTVAEDGQKAFDLVKMRSSNSSTSEDSSPEPCSPFDLIFMDVQMPNMDGLTSTKLIRKHGFKRPIVALTAFAEQSNVDDCLESGMDYFLAKPVKRPMLKKVLTEYCSPSPEPRRETIREAANKAEAVSSDVAKRIS